MSIKSERVASIIKKNVSEILNTEITNSALGFVTVTDVTLTTDLSLAKIYVTFLDQRKSDRTNLEELNKVKGLIRSKLAKTLSIRKCPDLQFYIDHSLETGNRIEQIINELNSKSQN